jgi:hypothetical protein
MAKIKGSSVISSIDLTVETHGEAGLKQVIDMLDEKDRGLMKNPLSTTWYDLDFFCRWLKASVAVTCNGNETGLIERSERGLRKQLTGIYKVFALLSSPQSVMNRLAAINETYFQGVTPRVTTLSPARHIISYEGLGPSHRLFEYCLIGWWTQILSTTRAKNPKVELKTSVASGKSCEVALSWDE